MAVSITLTVSNADAQRVLNAIGYDPNTDGDPTAFFKSWLSQTLRRTVNQYELQQNTNTFNSTFSLPVT